MNNADLKIARSGEVTCHNFARLGYKRLTWGVYGPPVDTLGADNFEARRQRFVQRVRAVIAAYQGTSVALHGCTGLQVLGVALPESAEDWDNIHLCVPIGVSRPRRRGVVAHATSRLDIWRMVRGVPVLHPVDLWVQLRGLTQDELVEVGDGLVRRQRPLLTIAQLRKRLDELAGAHGVEPVRRVARFVTPGTDSMYETRVRMLIVRAGLPTPVVNLPAPVPSIGRTYHLDMGYEEERIGVEFDGRIHVGDGRQMDIDAARHRDLQDAGWFIIRVTASHLSDPRQFLRPLERALIMRAP